MVTLPMVCHGRQDDGQPVIIKTKLATFWQTKNLFLKDIFSSALCPSNSFISRVGNK